MRIGVNQVLEELVLLAIRAVIDSEMGEVWQ